MATTPFILFFYFLCPVLLTPPEQLWDTLAILVTVLICLQCPGTCTHTHRKVFNNPIDRKRDWPLLLLTVANKPLKLFKGRRWRFCVSDVAAGIEQQKKDWAFIFLQIICSRRLLPNENLFFLYSCWAAINHLSSAMPFTHTPTFPSSSFPCCFCSPKMATASSFWSPIISNPLWWSSQSEVNPKRSPDGCDFWHDRSICYHQKTPVLSNLTKDKSENKNGF